MKTCSKCGEEKDLSEYYTNKTKKMFYNSECKMCTNSMNKEYYLTIGGVVSSIYSRQKSNSRKRGHQLPGYTKKELYDWILNQPDFENMYEEWVLSGYKSDLKPSVDRIDDSIGYNFDNIRLVTWWKNNLMGRESNNKPVLQVLYGVVVAEFKSMTDASKHIGVSPSVLTKACNPKRPTPGGFEWYYKED